MGEENLVLSLRDLPRQVGSRKEQQILWQVPEGWHTEVAKVPEGVTIPLAVEVTALDKGVYVQVSGSAPMQADCIRCLKPVEFDLPVQADEVYVEQALGKRRPDPALADGAAEVEGDLLDRELLIQHDTVDLEPVLRDAILGQAPFQPLCSDDCLGMCEHCGILLKDAEPGHSHQFIDPRFAALAQLLGPESAETSDG